MRNLSNYSAASHPRYVKGKSGFVLAGPFKKEAIRWTAYQVNRHYAEQGRMYSGRISTDHDLAQSAGAEVKRTEGGIDARNMGVTRTGALMKAVVDNAALERVIMKAPGLKGVILDIHPCPVNFLMSSKS